MKAIILSVAALVSSAGQVFAADGNIAVSTHSVYDPSSNQVYNIPIWVDLNSNGVFDEGEGIGTYAAAIGERANFALFVQDNPTPIATSIFRSDIYGAFLGSPFFQTANVPGYGPGVRAPLRIKVWVGASFDTAGIRASWDFVSRPLGGTPPVGVPIIPPGLDGWANPDGTGFMLAVPPGPVAGADLITRASLSDARVPIETLVANDSDTNGGSVIFVGADSISSGGAAISVANGEVIYHATNPAPDFFFYTVRNSAGGVARGRVDVTINDADGMIVFANQKIPMSGGSDFYDTRIYVDADFDGGGSLDENFGDFAATYYNAPAKLGLFLKGNDTPLAVGSFGSGTAGFFLASPASQTVVIPGVPPGAQVDLTIKAWIGSSFEPSRVKGSWDITSRPLGGVVAGQSFPIPGLTGWGNESIASGYGLSPGPKPVVGADIVNRPYRANVTIDIATLLANDSDPEGGALTFVGADSHSMAGAEITVSGSTITYKHFIDASDYFFYTVRSAHGAKAKCRVDVKMGDPIGEINITNAQIPKADGTGLYDIPVWVDIDTNNVRGDFEGLGAYASNFRLNAYLGLSLQGNPEVFAKYRFASGTNGAFLEAPGGTNVLVPGTIPGQRAQLTVKAWIGENFENASVKGSWDFTSLPLGGPREGDSAVPTPTLSGWGDEGGAGFALPPGEIPVLQPIVYKVPVWEWISFPIDRLLPLETNIGFIRFVSVDHFTLLGSSVSIDTNMARLAFVLTQNDSITYSVATMTRGLAMGRLDLQVTNGPAKIAMANRLVRHSAGPGAYNVPVWIDANFNGRRDAGEGIGTFANQSSQTAQLGLFLPDTTTPLATARFRTDAAGAFLEDMDFQDVVIPGAAPGSTPPLTLKAWIGDNYETASLKASWNFTPRQLGGNALAGLFEIPDVSGWGEESNNTGYAIVPGTKPKTYGEVLTRQPGQNVNTKIADMVKNDVDPDGGALTLVSIDESSREGAVVTVLGNTVYYIAPINDTGAPDYFEYTVRNSKGGIAKGRVDVVVTDAQGQFNTRLTIENFGDANHISFRGVIGSNYLIQYRDTVDTAWQNLGAATYESFGIFSAEDVNATPTRFYRVQTAQP